MLKISRRQADISFLLQTFKLLSRDDVDFVLVVRTYSRVSNKQRIKLDRLVDKVRMRLMSLAFDGRRWRP